MVDKQKISYYGAFAVFLVSNVFLTLFVNSHIEQNDNLYNIFFINSVYSIFVVLILWILDFVIKRLDICGYVFKRDKTNGMYNEENIKLFNELRKDFTLTTEDLDHISSKLLNAIDYSLTHPYSINHGKSIPMLSSYITDISTNNKSGIYLAIDLGGTHVRAIKVVLREINAFSCPDSLSEEAFQLTQSKKRIPDNLKCGSGYDLFDYIADTLHEFLIENDILNTDELPLGFTFSFPVKQHSVNSGTILKWNKNFRIDNTIGMDPVKLLQDSLIRKGINNIKIVALVNDAVGTLVSAFHKDINTKVGIVLGTGSNLAYVERLNRIKKLDIKVDVCDDDIMLINTEFGAFNPYFTEDNEGPYDEPIVFRNKYDKMVDNKSNNTSAQLYEKMMSGYYIGEIVRTVILELVKSKDIFQEAIPPTMIQKDRFGTNILDNEGSVEDNRLFFGLIESPHSFCPIMMSKIERDVSSELFETKDILENTFSIYNSSFNDRKIIKFICELVAIRSARLSAVFIASIIKHLNLFRSCDLTKRSDSDKKITSSKHKSKMDSKRCINVAIGGSLFEYYPYYERRIRDALKELFGGIADSINLIKDTDGSGLGAALIASMVYTK